MKKKYICIKNFHTAKEGEIYEIESFTPNGYVIYVKNEFFYLRNKDINNFMTLRDYNIKKLLDNKK